MKQLSQGTPPAARTRDTGNTQLHAVRRGRIGRPGQSLVEFALTLLVFMVVTLGLLDGLRVVFYFSQIQEAAREGARWGAVQVARTVNGTTPWGTFNDTGNYPEAYCNNGTCGDVIVSQSLGVDNRKLSNGNSTIIGAVGQALTAVDLSDTSATTVQIATTIPLTATEDQQTNDQITNNPVTVTVTYPFKPILGLVFGGVTINLKGSSAMLHE